MDRRTWKFIKRSEDAGRNHEHAEPCRFHAVLRPMALHRTGESQLWHCRHGCGAGLRRLRAHVGRKHRRSFEVGCAWHTNTIPGLRRCDSTAETFREIFLGTFAASVESHSARVIYCEE